MLLEDNHVMSEMGSLQCTLTAVLLFIACHTVQVGSIKILYQTVGLSIQRHVDAHTLGLVLEGFLKKNFIQKWYLQ